MKQYLAIDIGGTSVKLGFVDETGGILAKAEDSVSFDGWQTPILTTVLAAAERFLTARGKDPQALEGIGVSATGQINSHTGVVVGTSATCPTTSAAPSRSSWKPNSTGPSPWPTTPTACAWGKSGSAGQRAIPTSSVSRWALASAAAS